MILLKIPDSQELLMVHSTKGLPLKFRKFFLGSLFEPDRAGIMAKHDNLLGI